MALPNRQVLFVTLVVCLGCAFPFGYLNTSINPSTKAFQSFINGSFSIRHSRPLADDEFAVIWSWAARVIFIGAIVGLFITPQLIAWFGAKITIMLSGVPSVIGTTMQLIALRYAIYELYIVGRGVAGISIGIGRSAQASYLVEITPIKTRGFTGSIFGLCGGIFTFIGGILGMPVVFGSYDRLSYLIGVSYIPVVFMWLCSPLIPETATFEILRRNNVPGAIKVLKRMHGADVDVDTLISRIRRQQPRRMSVMIAENQSPLRQLTTRYRRNMGLAVICSLCQIFCGMSGLVTFSTPWFISTGMSSSFAQYTTLIMVALIVVFNLSTPILADKLGRRPLLLFSALGCWICGALFVAFGEIFYYTGHTWSLWTCAVTIFVFAIFFGCGLTSVPVFYGSEIVPGQCRAVSQTIAMTCGFIAQIVTGVGVFPLQEKIQMLSFVVIYLAPQMVFIIILFIHMPETNQRDMQEVAEELAKRGFNKAKVHVQAPINNINVVVSMTTTPNK